MSKKTAAPRQIYAFANTGYEDQANIGTTRAAVAASLVLTGGRSDLVFCVNSAFLRHWEEGNLEAAQQVFDRINADATRAKLGLDPLPAPLVIDPAYAFNPHAGDDSMEPVYVRLAWTSHMAPPEAFFKSFEQKPLTVILRNDPINAGRAVQVFDAAQLARMDPDAARLVQEESALPRLIVGLRHIHQSHGRMDEPVRLLDALPNPAPRLSREQGIAELHDIFGVDVDNGKTNVVVMLGDPKSGIGYYELTPDLEHLAELQASGKYNVLITTSYRTCASHLSELSDWQKGPTPFHFVHQYSDLDNKPNPRDALLAVGSKFIVTGDSLSMYGETMGTGKPVAIIGPATSHIFEGMGHTCASFNGLDTRWFIMPKNERPAAQFKSLVEGRLAQERANG